MATTGAVARHFPPSLIEHGIVDTVTIGEALKFAAIGDRLQTVNPSTTIAHAINLFSGQTELNIEPPAAVLVLGTVGRPPQLLCSRADLAELYGMLDA